MTTDTTTVDLYELLPEIYRIKDTESKLEDFLQPLSFITEDFRDVIEDWTREFNIGTVRDEYLDHIGNLYGYRARTDVPNLEGKRRKIRYVMDLWERKGTPRSYYIAGLEIDIPTFGLDDNRYAVCVLSHQGKLSTYDECYLEDNKFYHEGVLILTTEEYVHPQIFFELFQEFLPAGFLLYITQTVHQGVVATYPFAEGEWWTRDAYWIVDYLNRITADQIWFDLTLDVEDVFLDNLYYLDESVGYKDNNLPFDPQKLSLPPNYNVPDGYTGPYSDEVGRYLGLDSLVYPRTDPRITRTALDTTAIDTTIVMVIDSSAIVWIENFSGATILNPYKVFVASDKRYLDHTHWITPGIQGNMTENTIRFDGTNWSHTDLSGRINLIDTTSSIDVSYIENIEQSSGATLNDPYIVLVNQDNRIDKTSPIGISGDMSNKIIEYNGNEWRYSSLP